MRRELREMVLFAAHDLLRDAPFSRMDLISCRNLLIYLNREAQGRVLETFHFALRPDGRLFLGTSESVDDDSRFFRVIDKKHRIYVPMNSTRAGSAGPGSLVRTLDVREPTSSAPVVHGKRFLEDPIVPFTAVLGPTLDRNALTDLHLKLLERFGPPSILVNADHEIVHLSAQAGRFLQFAGGEPTRNLLRLVHPMLRVDLRSALFRAMEAHGSADAIAVPCEVEGQSRLVDLRVSPAGDLAPGFLLIAFSLRTGSPNSAAVAGAPDAEPTLRQLDDELEDVRAQLRETVEQYEASTEELKASNEELQAMNEELRSATEELETSREELQSINEELTTVNQEMKGKVDELAHANSDLQNLMASTAIGTVFLNRELAITRYTPSAVDLFHLIPGDLGRPLAHVKHRLDYAGLLTDAEHVRRTLLPMEREVRKLPTDGDAAQNGSAGHGRWFLARLLPYRTIEDCIAGVVLTFVDVTARKRAEQAVAADLADTERLRELSAQVLPEGDPDILMERFLDVAIAITRADAGTVQLYDAEARELRLMVTRGIPGALGELFTRVPVGLDVPCAVALESGRRAILHYDDPAEPDPTGARRLHLEMAGLRSGQSTPLRTRAGRAIGMISTHWQRHHEPCERDLRFLDLLARQAADALERQQNEHARRAQMEELSRFNAVAVGRETRMIALKQEINALCERLGEPGRYPLDLTGEA